MTGPGSILASSISKLLPILSKLAARLSCSATLSLSVYVVLLEAGWRVGRSPTFSLFQLHKYLASPVNEVAAFSL